MIFMVDEANNHIYFETLHRDMREFLIMHTDLQNQFIITHSSEDNFFPLDIDNIYKIDDNLNCSLCARF